MLDSMVFDRLLEADVEVDVSLALRQASEAGRIRLLVTHIQVDELLDTPDGSRRRSLIHALMRVGVREMPTHGVYVNKSRVGHARLGDEADGERIKAFVHGNHNELDDALIAATAAAEGAVLVTEERRLGRYRRHFPELQLWNADRLIGLARELVGDDRMVP